MLIQVHWVAEFSSRVKVCFKMLQTKNPITQHKPEDQNPCPTVFNLKLIQAPTFQYALKINKY